MNVYHKDREKGNYSIKEIFSIEVFNLRVDRKIVFFPIREKTPNKMINFLILLL